MDRGEAKHAAASTKVDFDMCSEKGLLWSEAGDAETVTEEALSAMGYLVAAVRYEALVSKKGYVDFLSSLAHEVQSKCSQCEGTTRQLDAPR